MMYEAAYTEVAEFVDPSKVEGEGSLSDKLDKLVMVLLERRVAEAYAVGVRPSYSDWKAMRAAERSVWSKVAEQAKRAELAVAAAATGNPVVTKKALHAGDETAERFDAIEEGLRASEGIAQ